MIFMGYDNQSKAYRCYNPITKKLTISRDVKFGNDMYESSTSADGTFGENMKSSDQPTTVNLKSSSKNLNDEGIQEEPVVQEERLEQKETAGNNLGDNVIEPLINEIVAVPRRTKRLNKGIGPRRLINEMNLMKHEIVEPKTYAEAISCNERNEWIRAMTDEMHSLKKNKTWSLVNLPEGRNAIGCKWVYKIKTNADGSVQRFKARLVAQGFSQKFGTDYNDIFAPVVRQSTFRTLLTVASKEKLIVHLDVKTAFLNGNLNEVIYMKQPAGFIDGDSNSVCCLNKSIYGLKQAARAWNETIHRVLVAMGFVQSRADQCLYSKSIDSSWCYVLIYVDDIIVACATDEQLKCIEVALKKEFELENLGRIKHYLNIEVTQDENGFFELCQSSYIEQIVSDFGLQNAKDANSTMDINYYSSSGT